MNKKNPSLRVVSIGTRKAVQFDPQVSSLWFVALLWHWVHFMSIAADHQARRLRVMELTNRTVLTGSCDLDSMKNDTPPRELTMRVLFLSVCKESAFRLTEPSYRRSHSPQVRLLFPLASQPLSAALFVAGYIFAFHSIHKKPLMWLIPRESVFLQLTISVIDKFWIEIWTYDAC